MLRFYRQKRNILFSDDGESLLYSQRTEMSQYSIKRVKVGSLTKYRRTEHCTLKSCDAIVPAIIAVLPGGQFPWERITVLYDSKSATGSSAWLTEMIAKYLCRQLLQQRIREPYDSKTYSWKISGYNKMIAKFAIKACFLYLTC